MSKSPGSPLRGHPPSPREESRKGPVLLGEAPATSGRAAPAGEPHLPYTLAAQSSRT